MFECLHLQDFINWHEHMGCSSFVTSSQAHSEGALGCFLCLGLGDFCSSWNDDKDVFSSWHSKQTKK